MKVPSAGHPAPVALVALGKRFGSVVAVRDLDLRIGGGEFFSLLGPSGSGKSTLLGLIAGFHPPTAGRLWIGAEDVTDWPPFERNVGVVFQNYALFPHLNVFDNVAFGPRMRHLSAAVISRRVERALATVHLTGLEDRWPHQLSGGQQQRVALARALVVEPQVLLLDEPLAALDKKLRDEMRLELKQIQRSSGVTTIFVTHDRQEAFALSDRLGVLEGGHLVQVGTPQEVYQQPRNRFVADFVGAQNIFAGRLVRCDDRFAWVALTGLGDLCCTNRGPGRAAGDLVDFYIRPEHVRLGEPSCEAVNRIPGRVLALTYLGSYTEVWIEAGGGLRWVSYVSEGAAGTIPEPGSMVTLSVPPESVIIL